MLSLNAWYVRYAFIYTIYNRYSIVFGHFSFYAPFEMLRCFYAPLIRRPLLPARKNVFQTYTCKNKKHIFFFIRFTGSKARVAQLAYMQNISSMFLIPTSTYTQ